MNLSQMISGLEDKAAESIKTEEGDFLKDGLWHCGKCGTAKQTRVTILGEVRTPMCLCKCEGEKRDREMAEEKHRETVLRLRKQAFSESKMEGWTFAKDDGESEQVMSIAKRYVDNFPKMLQDGKGLLFFGTVGTGKSFASGCIANALIDKEISCIMTNFAEIRKSVQASFDGAERLAEKFSKCTVLIIDDLATESNTPYMQELIFSIIDSRCRAKLPLIVTTNLTREQILKPADISYQRIFSRLLECCIPVKVVGEDRRKKMLKDTFNEYSDILGLGG